MGGEAPVSTWPSFIEPLAKILVAIITAICTYFIARYNVRIPAQRTILEEQLTKVFAPIQQIRAFSAKMDKSALCLINEVIRDNFAIVPAALSDLWRDRDKRLSEFLDLNKACFEYAQKELGYSRKKIAKEEKGLLKKTLPMEPSFFPKRLLPLVVTFALVDTILKFYLSDFLPAGWEVALFVIYCISVIATSVFSFSHPFPKHRK